MCGRRFSWKTRDGSHTALVGTHRRRYRVLDMVRVVVIVAITPDRVQPPMTSIQ